MRRIPWRRIRQVVTGLSIMAPVVVMLVFVGRGCETASVPNVHPPPGVTLPPPSPTSAPKDLTGVQLAAVDGTTTVPAVPDSGTSQLSGTVTGPQGPVPGATVRIEHLVDNHVNPVDVLTDANGHWGLGNIAGGRYRVRAFLPPTLAQAEPQVFFLNEGDQRSLDLGVDQYTGSPEVAVAIAPDPPNLGQPASVVVRVTRKAVSPDGVIRAAAVPGANVTFNTSDAWSVSGPSATATNENGDATFVVQCRKAGANQVNVTVRVPGVAQPVTAIQDVPACIDPRSTSTTTTTTAPGTPPSSTTTTAPPPN